MSVDARLARAFAAGHPQDAARVLERAEPAHVAKILTDLPPALSAAVYRELAPAPAAACSAKLGDDTLAPIVEALPLDIAAAAMRRLDVPRRAALLARVSDTHREELRALLTYPENTAGALADPLALALPEDITVREAQRQMRGSQRHLFYHVFVVARDRTLRGTLAMPELMSARSRQKLGEVMQHEVVWLDAYTDLATVVAHPAWREFDALPVVDGARKLIGAIRHRMIRQLDRERTRPMVDTIVGLSELYWAGLSGMLASLTPPQSSREEDTNVK